jgi:hypothetical protein
MCTFTPHKTGVALIISFVKNRQYAVCGGGPHVTGALLLWADNHVVQGSRVAVGIFRTVVAKTYIKHI